MGVRLPSSAQRHREIRCFLFIATCGKRSQVKNDITLEVKFEKESPVYGIITIRLEAEDINTPYTKNLRKTAAQVQLKGFRPGKAPVAHVEKLYGRSIKLDTVNEILSTQLNEYLKTSDLAILGNPLSKFDEEREPWDFKSGYDFKFEVGLQPEVELADLSKFEYGILGVEVTDEIVQETIDNELNRQGTTTVPETSELGDRIYGTLKKADGSWSDKVLVPTNKVKAEGLAQFIGKKIGDEFPVNLQTAFEEKDLKHFSSLPAEDYASSDLVLVVDNLNRVAPAELNEEFFKKVFRLPEGATMTEEEFRAELKTALVSNYEQQGKQHFNHMLQHYVSENSKVELPEGFLARWLRDQIKEKITPEQFQNEVINYLGGMKWVLIRDNYLKSWGIELTDEVVIDYMANQFMSYTPAEEESEERIAQARAFAQRYLQMENGKYFNKAASEAFDTLFFSKAIETIQPKTKVVSAEEFASELGAHQHHH